MRILRPASEDAVIAAFLQAEADHNGRYRGDILPRVRSAGRDLAVVLQPDVADVEQNSYRRELLGEVRGFGRGEGMFIGFPSRVDWYRVALSREELLEVRYLDDHGGDNFWVTLSGGSRRPADAVARIRNGVGPDWTLTVWDLTECADIADRLGDGTLPELILGADPQADHTVVIEGHGRLTSFALFPDRVPSAIEAFCGVAPAFSGWALY